MDKSRQEDLNLLINEALTNEPALKEALEIFQFGQTQYSRAINTMSSVEIVQSNSSNLESKDASVVDQNES